MSANEPGRPMRLAKRQVTDASEITAIVDACKTVRIGCIDDEGMFIVPMNFGYEWDASIDLNASENRDTGKEGRTNEKPDNDPALTLWVHCAHEGRKVNAFARNPRVAIEMDCEDGLITGSYACAYSFAYRSVMGTGRVHPVKDAADKRHGLTKIMEHIAPGAPIAYSDEAIERVAIYRIDVNALTAKRREPKIAHL